MTDDTEVTHEACQHLKGKSLLRRYEIPIDHLDYGYIEGCQDIKELERIVKILRSGEEGSFPDLLRFTEDRLRMFSPNNRLLRTETPALTRDSLSKTEWSCIVDELSSWKKDVSETDIQLSKGNEDTAVNETYFPPVRQAPVSKCETKSESKQKTKPRISDYAAWDKYDVDTELLKMDLEQEQKKEIVENKADKRQTENNRLIQVVKEAEHLSELERRVLAEQEKNRGNEYYETKDYAEAEKYYTASIAIWPTAKAYNNRAACHLKRRKYPEVVRDANSAIELEPNNIKALFRRGLALKHCNKFTEALEDMNELLRLEPNHTQAQNIAKEIEERVLNLSHGHGQVSDKIQEIQSISYADSKQSKDFGVRQSSSNRHSRYTVNEWGLPKEFCYCKTRGNVVVDKKVRPLPLVGKTYRQHNLAGGDARIVELSEEPVAPKPANHTKLKIVEVEKHSDAEDFCRPKKCNIVDKRTVK